MLMQHVSHQFLERATSQSAKHSILHKTRVPHPAAEALNLRHPFLKTRTLSSATKSSRAKAMRITDALLPYKPRPATSAALARRLVSGALGLKVNISREVREAEKQKLKDAKGQMNRLLGACLVVCCRTFFFSMKFYHWFLLLFCQLARLLLC